MDPSYNCSRALRKKLLIRDALMEELPQADGKQAYLQESADFPPSGHLIVRWGGAHPGKPGEQRGNEGTNGETKIKESFFSFH